MSSPKIGNHSERSHAKLSASGAFRWLNCPGSIRLEEGIPDKSSLYSEEGTLAHEIVELHMKKEVISEKITARKFNSEMRKIKKDPLFHPEMVTHAVSYCDKIIDLASEDPNSVIYSEYKISLERIIPEGFGTCDTIIISKDQITIVDFKYGQGVKVSAIDNPQLKLYALGALDLFDLIYNFKTVKMVIIQPRLEEGYSEYVMSKDDLIAWGDSIKPIAQVAYDGQGETVAGEWCRFCKARHACSKRAEAMINAIDPEAIQNSIDQAAERSTPENVKKPAEMLTDDQAGEYLKKGKFLIAWYNDLKDHVERKLMSGIPIKGWKVVAGRTSRRWTDEEAAFGDILVKGLAEYDQLFEKKALTLSQIEKLLTKKIFDKELSKYVTRTDGKPTVVEESDSRPELQMRVSAAEAFGIEPSEDPEIKPIIIE